MQKKIKSNSPANRQQGFVLIVSLMLLAIFSLLTLTSLQETSLQALSTAHLKYQNYARQYAEGLLRQVESNVQKDSLSIVNNIKKENSNVESWVSVPKSDPNFLLKYRLRYLACYVPPSATITVYTFEAIAQSEHIQGAKRTVKSIFNVSVPTSLLPDTSLISSQCTLLPAEISTAQFGRMAWTDLD